MDIGELLEGDEVAAPSARSERSDARGRRARRSTGGVAGEADVRANTTGPSAIGGVVAGTLVVVVGAFGTPAGEMQSSRERNSSRSRRTKPALQDQGPSSPR